MVGRNIVAAYTKYQLLHDDEFAMNSRKMSEIAQLTPARWSAARS